MKNENRGSYMRWWRRVNPPAPWPPGFGPNSSLRPQQFLFEFALPVQLWFSF